ncbi:MAG: DUF5011 domain-containing protein [Lachnospiraceae bacterium]|nr:DUF5011 domain-containing protein [Lachnospiraceae bacterium]
MKKLLVFAIALCFAAGVGVIYLRISEDHTAPEISYSDSIVYSDGMTTEELLEGVIATDDEDGDVSDSLTVERVVTNSEEAKATVIYVAKDSHNNIAKVTRVIDYDIEETETESETEKPETEAVKTGAVQSETDTEEEETDTDIEIENAADTDTDTAEAPDAAETTASQAESEQTQVQTESEEELAADAPRITLKQSRVTIQVGDTFEPTDYVDSITDDYDNKYTLWRRIQVEGNYDTSIAGIYQLVYYVTDTSGNSSNRATLLLIVEEEE